MFDKIVDKMICDNKNLLYNIKKKNVSAHINGKHFNNYIIGARIKSVNYDEITAEKMIIMIQEDLIQNLKYLNKFKKEFDKIKKKYYYMGKKISYANIFLNQIKSNKQVAIKEYICNLGYHNLPLSKNYLITRAF